MSGVVLGLGSNRSYKGMSPLQVLTRACTMLESFLGELTVSGVYRTKAMYVTDQEDFYNAVVYGHFSGKPQELLVQIHKVERELGRNRSREFRNGPRSMDIDIEMFADVVMESKRLVLPHPRMEERAFVLTPFLDVLQKCADVNNKGTCFYEKRLSELSDQGVEKLLSKEEFFSLYRQDAAKFKH